MKKLKIENMKASPRLLSPRPWGPGASLSQYQSVLPHTGMLVGLPGLPLETPRTTEKLLACYLPAGSPGSPRAAGRGDFHLRRVSPFS